MGFTCDGCALTPLHSYHAESLRFFLVSFVNVGIHAANLSPRHRPTPSQQTCHPERS